MTNPTPHGQVPAIQRYKIGYHSDEWGVRSLSPSGIYDDAGPWVRYADHVTALAAGKATAAQQPGAAYAELPDALEALQLKSCPCGATPTALQITGDEQAKWAHVSGNCCGEWEIEYRNNYTKLASTEAMTLAAAAWNEAPRASHGQAPASKIEGLTAAQEPLGVEFERVLHDNLFDLYEESPTQPAPQQEAQEPVARLEIGKTKGGVSLTHIAEPAAYQLQEGVYALYTAPQPVAREPLTPEQIAEMMRDTWGCASIAPRHALAFARAVERAHGIKGGQHGTE